MRQSEADQRQRTLRSAEELQAAGLVAQADMTQLADVESRFATAVSPTMLALIDRADPTDPIARQFVPGADELTLILEETPDPIGDHAHAPVEGVVHRYPDRVLLKVTPVCPVVRVPAVPPSGSVEPGVVDCTGSSTSPSDRT